MNRNIAHQVLNEYKIIEICIANLATDNESTEDDDTEETVGLTHH